MFWLGPILLDEVVDVFSRDHLCIAIEFVYPLHTTLEGC